MPIPQVLSVEDEAALRAGLFGERFEVLLRDCGAGIILMGSVAGLALRRRVAVLLALDVGLRLAELTGLLWDDCVLPARSRGYVTVRGALNHSNRGRRVPMSELVDRSLRGVGDGLRKMHLFVGSARVLGRVGLRSPLDKRTVGRWIRIETA